MTQPKRIYEQRIYEGEWRFVCQSPCGGFVVEYSFDKYDDYSSYFLSNLGSHATQKCHICGGTLEWAGYAGDMPLSDSLAALVQGKHFMASTVILSAIVEYSIDSLLWAAFIDHGLDRESANRIAGGRIGRVDAVRMIRSLTGSPVTDISFPVRNRVAHGKGFGMSEEFYHNELETQITEIRKWVDRILDGNQPKTFMPTQCERWLLYMNTWSYWLVSHIKGTPTPRM